MTTGFMNFLVIGAVAGLSVGAGMRGGGFGGLGNSLIGIVGGVVSGFLSSSPAISGDLMSSMVIAAMGAGVLLYGTGRFRNTKESSIYYKGEELWIQRKPLNRK